VTNTRTALLLALGATLVACNGTDDNANADPESLASAPLMFKGASLAGAEFGVDPYGVGPLPGTFAVNYMYPDATYATGYTSPDYFLSKGMTTFRLPFRWERLQPTRNAPFNAAELGRLTTTINHLTAKGATVLLDPHNYARYGAALIGSSAVPNADFADLWSRLATTFKSNPHVLFGLMNEPHDMPTEQWASAANAAIAAIRATGAGNLVLVPGNGWTGAESWAQNWYGTPNATVMLTITDPANNFAFEVHQYLDNSGGTDPVCVSATIGSQRMAGLTTWLRNNGRKAFLGEFGGGSSATCLAAEDDLLKHIETNSDVYLGWTYWAGGPWWGTNWMAIEPVAGADVPQMTTLLPHLAATATVTPPTCSDGVKNGTETGVDCGGSCAPCASTCAQTSYGAAAMTHSVGAAVTGGWNIYSNGYVSTSASIAAGQTTITVNAKGSVGAGVWPHMVVSLDGTSIGSTFVSAASWTDYVFPVTAAVGAHQLRLTFDNDYASTTEDRNLYVAKVTMGCGTSPAAPPAAPVSTCSDGVKNGTETGVDCGGSCPACAPPPPPACTGATFQAASMTHSTGGAAPGGWNVWSNGYIAANNTFVAGPTTITVHAMGSVGAGVWPHMVVSVGGTDIGSASVQSGSWLPYPFTFTATAGTQEVRVTFDNDYASTTEDRNLYVADVAVSCGGTAASCVPSTCAASGKNCGTASDGCGGTLSCGTCGGSSTCGGGGVANVCGAGPALPSASSAPIRILPLGDSITLGVNGGYRNGLWTRLLAAGKSIDYVGSQFDQYTKAPDKDHEGHPGFTIGNISASTDGWMASYAPDYVLLMIGTNDVAWWSAQTGSQIADQNALLIDQILADRPSAWVVVASIPPLSSSIIQPNNIDRAQLGQDYNAALQQRVQTRITAGKHVRWADVYSVLTVADLYDGVHPTEAAADKVAQVWYNALAPILP
jgi:endoglucanase